MYMSEIVYAVSFFCEEGHNDANERLMPFAIRTTGR